MPTLQFKGKNIIWNHHLSVPYHTLDEAPKLHYHPETTAGNLIIEGDNLLALKALLPQYTGKIKCIYIDPPYNTGNENWVYNDNVNNPMIKEWLGKEVGKDDLTRHDKWLCMMTPRLKLMRDLLIDDGVIFISIDDNEQHNLRQVMDQIFGEDNFIANIIWQKIHSTKNDAKYLSDNHEYILLYAKNIENITINLLERTSKMNERYSNPDNDPRGDWSSGDLVASEERKEGYYEVTGPTGKIFNVPQGKHWVYSQENLKQMIIENRIWFGKDGTAFPRLKRFLSEVQQGKKSDTIWINTEVGHNQEATREIRSIFSDEIELAFDTPKPVRLINRILQLGTDKEDTILDAFAGSGTTMHAVMDLNKEDGGDRKCILIQAVEATTDDPKKNICKDITRERIKRAIDKYNYKSGFRYFKVGIPIDAETILSGQLPTYKQFAEYVYYLCTGNSLPDKKTIDEKSYYVGSCNRNVIYLLYKQNFDTLTKMPLNFDMAEQLIKANPGKRIIVYAPACFLDDDYMKDNNIDFVGIPYNLFSRISS
ncbi:MAG: hypothetical protein LBV68_03000 [Spirochaetaceae bacterium]|jgi:adenine-specific DNA-methyltransferase|nr:hypothetical protein [Spirochaetaceae bacterium]